MADSGTTPANEDPNTLRIGHLVLQFRQERGVVQKVEQWSEQRISGRIKPLQVYNINGNISSSGGGGSISTSVRRWMRLYVDIGNGRERVHKVPESFAAREGHTIVANYLLNGKSLSLIKLSNPHTGGWYKTGYDIPSLTGRGFLRYFFFVLAVGCVLFALAGIHDVVTTRSDVPMLLRFWRMSVPLGGIAVAAAAFVGLGFLVTSKPYRNRKQIEDFIRRIERF